MHQLRVLMRTSFQGWPRCLYKCSREHLCLISLVGLDRNVNTLSIARAHQDMRSSIVRPAYLHGRPWSAFYNNGTGSSTPCNKQQDVSKCKVGVAPKGAVA